MAFSVKLQIVGGKPDQHSADYQGAEPNDQHRTIAEKDPIDDSELTVWLQAAKLVNSKIAELVPANDFGHVELRIMDSNP